MKFAEGKDGGKIGIGTTSPDSMITIACKCGGVFKMDGGGEWEVDLRGDWAFKHSCGHEIVLPRDIIQQVTGGTAVLRGSRGDSVVCAAIKMPDGYIIRGHRHSDAHRVASGVPRYSAMNNKALIQEGFMTGDNRFVDRKEAYKIFVAAGEISVDEAMHPMAKRDELFSEDLY